MLLLPVAAFSQKADSLLGVAMSQYRQNLYKESAESYELAFKTKNFDPTEYYNAACSWALAGDTLRSYKNLFISVSKGFNDVRRILTDPDLKGLRGTSSWQKVISSAQKNKDKFEENLNKPLIRQLEDIYLKDQTLRKLYTDAVDKFGNDSEEMDYYWRLISQEDSLNLIRVVDIIEKYGWVGKSQVGKLGNMTLWLVIQHAPLEFQERYLPLLRASVGKQESQGMHLAMLVDRIRMLKNQPQVYGSQVVVDKKTGRYVVYDLEAPELVNRRRSEVGLGPIQDYVKKWKIVWEVEQR